CVENGRYALSVTAVERIVFAAEVTHLSDAPETVLGLINVEGEIMPVVDVRRRLGFPLRDMELSDRFIVTKAGGAPIALLVDSVEGVVELPAHPISDGNSTAPWTVSAAVGADGEIVVVQNISALISADVLAHLDKNCGDAHEQ
ncbi:MAG: chemotaxis protein CheW, partial [Lentisphaerota bacterium]